MNRFLILLLSPLLLTGCSSSQPVVTPGGDFPLGYEEPEPTALQISEENTDTSGLHLERYRSSLSDSYASRNNEIPEVYARIRVEKEEEDNTNSYEGYRVQIYSGQEVAIADTIAAQFRAWSDTTIVGYQARTYTFFKAPYYRVHVGDFHDRNKALSFSNILKRRFRDAWVVYDRVNPWNVPADTVHISVK